MASTWRDVRARANLDESKIAAHAARLRGEPRDDIKDANPPTYGTSSEQRTDLRLADDTPAAG
ncbi:hypothetical protein [Micromonospora tulbaghiae]|uniref:hypothetical protein n=1 Tax=Micromonospora tulbaghiae TaxID=479978 RepID=UPI0033EB167A